VGWFESLSVYMLRTYFKIQDVSMWNHSLKLAWIAWDLWSICRHRPFSETSQVSADASKLRHVALMTLQVQVMQVTDLDFGGNWETSACHVWVSHNRLRGNAAEHKTLQNPQRCRVDDLSHPSSVNYFFLQPIKLRVHRGETTNSKPPAPIIPTGQSKKGISR